MKRNGENVLCHKLIIYIFISLCFSINAEVESSENVELMNEYNKKIQKSLMSLKSLPANDYFKRIDEYRGALEKHFDHKKRVCDGEFSTIVLKNVKDTEGKVINKKVRLSKSERRLCFRELKALQVTFVNNMYVARKRYLNFLHTRRLEDLDESREATIQSLHSSFKR
jgi:hypothetical protein